MTLDNLVVVDSSVESTRKSDQFADETTENYVMEVVKADSSIRDWCLKRLRKDYGSFEKELLDSLFLFLKSCIGSSRDGLIDERDLDKFFENRKELKKDEICESQDLTRF